MIEVTDLVIHQVEFEASKRIPKPIGLYVGIRGGGCNGFEYVFEWRDILPDVPERKNLWPPFTTGMTNQVTIYTDPKSYIYLDNSILDFKKTLVDRGFYWKNPNQTGECGCGKSIQF